MWKPHIHITCSICAIHHVQGTCGSSTSCQSFIRGSVEWTALRTLHQKSNDSVAFKSAQQEECNRTERQNEQPNKSLIEAWGQTNDNGHGRRRSGRRSRPFRPVRRSVPFRPTVANGSSVTVSNRLFPLSLPSKFLFLFFFCWWVSSSSAAYPTAPSSHPIHCCQIYCYTVKLLLCLSCCICVIDVTGCPIELFPLLTFLLVPACVHQSDQSVWCRVAVVLSSWGVCRGFLHSLLSRTDLWAPTV